MKLELPQKTHPIDDFVTWFGIASQEIKHYPNAMTLCTATPDGKPSSRTVLLKEVRNNQLVFFTNYESRKASQIAQNPNVSITFYWPQLNAQVQFEGVLKKVSREESETYFATRPRESQIGAWASQQSQKIAGRLTLEQRVQEFENKFKDRDVPCPPHWGGYELTPNRVEFWLECSFRLHDRVLFEKDAQSENWNRSTLSP